MPQALSLRGDPQDSRSRSVSSLQWRCGGRMQGLRGCRLRSCRLNIHLDPSLSIPSASTILNRLSSRNHTISYFPAMPPSSHPQPSRRLYALPSYFPAPAPHRPNAPRSPYHPTHSHLSSTHQALPLEPLYSPSNAPRAPPLDPL